VNIVGRRMVSEVWRAVGAVYVVVSTGEGKSVRILHLGSELALRDDRLGRFLGLLVGLGIVRGTSTALEVFKTALKLLACSPMLVLSNHLGQFTSEQVPVNRKLQSQ
jgi:hypothetical protein